MERALNVVGVLSVVGSLIFVGLELRQSQRIALAGQVQARTEQAGTEIELLRNTHQSIAHEDEQQLLMKISSPLISTFHQHHVTVTYHVAD